MNASCCEEHIIRGENDQDLRVRIRFGTWEFRLISSKLEVGVGFAFNSLTSQNCNVLMLFTLCLAELQKSDLS